MAIGSSTSISAASQQMALAGEPGALANEGGDVVTMVPTRLGDLRVEICGSGPPAVLWHSLFVDLIHIGVGIDQGEDALGGGKPGLDLRPKRGEVQDGEVELVNADQEEIPGADSGNASRRVETANINEHA